jgi:hypothetical protein
VRIAQTIGLSRATVSRVLTRLKLSRSAFTAMLPDEKGFSASRFLRQAVAYFAHLGITVRRVLTDNGPVSVLAASPPPAAASISDLSAPASTRHAPMAKPNASSKPPSAKWAYSQLYQNSADRLAHLAPWIHSYVCQRREQRRGGRQTAHQVSLWACGGMVLSPRGLLA